jgi:Skp family chaperone for outer membrane proteins
VEDQAGKDQPGKKQAERAPWSLLKILRVGTLWIFAGVGVAAVGWCIYRGIHVSIAHVDLHELPISLELASLAVAFLVPAVVGVVFYLRRKHFPWALLTIMMVVAAAVMFILLAVQLSAASTAQSIENLKKIILVSTSAITGSLLGHLTYLATSTLGTWSNVHDAGIADFKERLASKRAQWQKKQADLTSATDARTKSQQSFNKENDTNKRASLLKDLEDTQGLVDKLVAEERSFANAVSDLSRELSKKSHGDPHWNTVANSISWERRLMRLPLAVGVAIGCTFLGELLGIDVLTTPKEGIAPLGPILGIAFMIGLYPRVFENALKGLADRLAGRDKSGSAEPPAGPAAAANKPD